MIQPTATPRSWQVLRNSDKTLIATLLLLLSIAMISTAQLVETLEFTLQSLLHIAPFLLLSIALAGYTRASSLDQLLTKVFAGRTAVVVVAAAAFGALSPFCSCGVIPIIAALLAAGMPLPGVMAFWLSSPLMDPEMFVLLTGELGLGFALAKLASATGIGMLAGYATWGAQRLGWFGAPLKVITCSCDSQVVTNPGRTVLRFWRDAERRRSFLNAVKEIGGYLFKWLTLAFILESLLLAYVPVEALAAVLGGDNPWAIPLASVVGVPAYLNGYAAIPTVAGLMELGMSAGAGLAFMIAGGVTSIPAAMAVYALVRRSVFAWYLLLALVGALVAGYGYLAVVGW
ncbi:MAG: permease [Trueperaceae bacterium]|nr:MAG: permease [Trueperaceae bacterium]